MWLPLALVCLGMKEPLKYPKGTAAPLLGIGALSMGVYMILFLEGLKRTGGAEAAIVLATAPIFTAVFTSLMGHERLRVTSLVGGLLAMSGVAMVVIGSGQVKTGTESHVTGDLLILGSAIVWSFQAAYSKPFLAQMSALRLLTLSMPGALPILIPYGLATSLQVDWQAVSPQSWLMFAHVTFLAGVVGFLGFYAGVKKIGAPAALLYQYFVPPIAVLFEWFLFGKVLQLWQWVGFVLVVAGVSIASYYRFQASKSYAPASAPVE